jgi:hypothetical protein
MDLHEEAIMNKHLEEEEHQKRQIETLDKYDWELVKRIGREQPFQKYIESLIMKGLVLLKDEIPNLDPLHSNTIEETSQRFHHSPLKESDEIKLIEDMRRLLFLSPYRMKSKGAPSRVKYFNDIDHSIWNYGKPSELKNVTF